MPALFSENTGPIEESLGYLFNNRKLLLAALTHKSYHHENPGENREHNERLEFLGDSVVGLVIAEKLFLNEELFSEADMSKMKSYLVKEAVLYQVASKLSLGSYLLLGKGEETSGGRQKKSVLSDALEAILGAIFLDSDYETVRSVMVRLFSDEIPAVIMRKEGHDYKSELQEKCQGLFGVLPEYRIVKLEGEEHRRVFTAEVRINKQMYGSGTGKSKKEAQMAAAKEALDRLLNE
jgi:ribonuclease-3